MKYEIPECPTTNRGYNFRLAVAFAKGCGGEVIQPLRETGFPRVNFDAGFPFMKRVATYGVLRGTDVAMKASEEFWYIDHGYFDGRKNYFRVTRDATIHSGEGDHDWDRFNKFNYELKDWKTNGEHIVICPPSCPQTEFLGLHGWLKNVVAQVRANTDRKIVISRKPSKRKGSYEGDDFYEEEGLENLGIHEAMKNAWLLVSDHSNTMTESLMAGVPIISTSSNRKIGSFDQIEAPTYDRDWLRNLAYNQWTIDEIGRGQAWEELNLWG